MGACAAGCESPRNRTRESLTAAEAEQLADVHRLTAAGRRARPTMKVEDESLESHRAALASALLVGAAALLAPGARPPTPGSSCDGSGRSWEWTSPTSSSSPWTPPGPTTWAATATGREDPEPRRAGAAGGPLRAGRLRRAADAAGPLLDPDGDVPHLPRRARQRQRRPGPVAEDAGRSPLGRGLRDGGLRRRVRPRRAVGAQPGLPALRRPLRPEEVQAPRPRKRPEAGQRGHGRGPRPGWRATSRAPSSPGSTSTTPTRPYEPPEPFALRVRWTRPRPASTTARSPSPTSRWGGCVSWLRANGIDQKTVVVVMGDHGEGLGSHGEGTHGYFVYDYALHVPFLVVDALRRAARDPGRLAGQRRRRVPHRPRRSAASRPRPEVHGRSLLPVMFRPREAGRSLRLRASP